MSRDKIVIKGAREHNLKGVDVELPRDKLVVLTGVSGSGKSSLAFDTLYAEGQRRYVESLSSYARQFLGQMEKPKVDFIGGLSPAIAIEQKSASKNPRSTVGTVTEVYDYMRLLFARVGTPHCPQCGREIGAQSAEQMVNRVLALQPGTRFMVLAPLVDRRKGEYKDTFAEAKAEGYVRVRVDGEIRDLGDDIKLNKKVKHSIEVVVDRLVMPAEGVRREAQVGKAPTADTLTPHASRPAPTGRAQAAAASEWDAFVTRLTDGMEQALRVGEGRVIISIQPAAGSQPPAAPPAKKAAAKASKGNEPLTPHASRLSTPDDGPPPEALEGNETLTPHASRLDTPEEWLMSESNTCTNCGISFPELSPQLFSFNAPQGACPTCAGLGTQLELDAQLLVPNPMLSIHQGAVLYWGEMAKKKESWGYRALVAIARHYGFDLDTPWEQLSEAQRHAVIYGSGKEKIKFTWENDSGSRGEFFRPWEGVAAELKRRFNQTGSDGMRDYYTQFMSAQPCPDCKGARLKPEALAVTVGGTNLRDLGHRNIAEVYAWARALGIPQTPGGNGTNGHHAANGVNASAADELLQTVPLAPNIGHVDPLTPVQLEIAGEVLKEIGERLGFLLNVGLHYLSLDRSSPSLSGGEAQRIRLASQIGSGLVGVMYILDEPSIGLHQRDNRKLLNSLIRLRDLGNTLIVVEHDLETMQAADWLVDFGPGAGVKGGAVVVAGTPDVVARNEESLTGRYLSGKLEIATPTKRREGNGNWFAINGASLNNLRDVDVRFPLGCFVAVTGVSGSGKSSLISETLYPALAARLNKAQLRPGPHKLIDGLDHLDKVIDIDQQPIGRTPRSNPATYVKLFDLLRELFASTNEAKLRGYAAGRFSFNLKGGRCEACEGNGEKCIDMQFLADVWVRCDVCKGKRYNRETLQVKYKGKSIADILEMDVQTALEFFDNVPRVRRILQTLHDVGLDYIKLGQPATTLSGGEAQRVKLAKELARVATGRTVYILDEPTTGLHFADVQNLLRVLHRLVDAGNTVVVIEHNLDVIKTADWVIDMGPEGGDGGGYVVAEGTPEQVAEVEASHTGAFLKEILHETQETIGR